MTLLTDLVTQSLAISVVVMLLLWLTRRSSAASRFLMVGAGFVVLAAAPLLQSLVPRVPLLPSRIAETVIGGPGSPAPGELIRFIWIAGVLLCWGSLAIDVISTRHSLRKAYMAEDPSAHNIVVTENLGPFVWGQTRPLLVLPAAVMNWPEASRKALIAHELAHVERGDWLLRLLMRAVRGLYWFNPLVWRLERRAILESEIACDDAVLASGVSPEQYAHLLVEVIRLKRSTRFRSAVAANTPPVMTRVAALLDTTRDRSPRSPLASLASMFVLILGLAMVAVTTAAPTEYSVTREGTRQRVSGKLPSGARFTATGGNVVIHNNGVQVLPPSAAAPTVSRSKKSRL